MAENRHIERIGDTKTNLQANLDDLQIAIETDNNKNLVYRDSASTYHILANQEENAEFLDVTIDDKLIHKNERQDKHFSTY